MDEKCLLVNHVVQFAGLELGMRDTGKVENDNIRRRF